MNKQLMETIASDKKFSFSGKIGSSSSFVGHVNLMPMNRN